MQVARREGFLGWDRPGLAEQPGRRYRTIPALAEVIEGRGRASQIREVAIDDVLGRSPVHPDQEQISARYQERVIMVTGAAGFIASELCWQLARFNPRAIIAYEVS